MTSCPKCRGRALSPTWLAEGLSAKGCQACGGTLVDLLAYRAWAHQKGVDTVSAGSASGVAIDDTKQAIPCPNCDAVMTKFRLAASADNKVDFCSNCDEVWLDGGEWQQLEDLGLRQNLGSVFTEPWQRHVRAGIADQAHESLLRERFGGDFGRIAEFRAWVVQHPEYERIMAWLRDRHSGSN